MLKIRRPLGRLIFNMGIAIPGKTVFLIETVPCSLDSISFNYGDVIMGTIASQITSLTIVYWTVFSGTDQRKHQSSASLAFVWVIYRSPVNSPHKRPVTRNMFLFHDVIMSLSDGNFKVTSHTLGIICLCLISKHDTTIRNRSAQQFTFNNVTTQVYSLCEISFQHSIARWASPWKQNRYCRIYVLLQERQTPWFWALIFCRLFVFVGDLGMETLWKKTTARTLSQLIKIYSTLAWFQWGDDTVLCV